MMEKTKHGTEDKVAEMRAIIVDDEQPSIDMLKMHLEREGSITVVGAYRKPKEALAAAAAVQPDVAFLDIHMPLMDGLELAELLTGQCDNLEIVFTTAYEQYALAAFRRNAIDYLLKPITPEAVHDTVKRLNKRRGMAAAPVRKNTAAIKCFGEFSVIGSSGERIGWRTAKAEELMAYLLMKRGQPISKWDMITDLWPECAMDERAHSNLHTTLYQVKKALKAAGVDFSITFMMRKYIVDTGGVQCESIEFEQFALQEKGVTPDNEHRYKRMLEMFAGPLFGDLDYAWCHADKERFLRYFSGMAHSYSRFLFERGQFEAAAALIQRLLAMSPFDEDAHEWILRMYAERQDRVAFVRHFHKMQAILRDELGLQPKPVLQQVYQMMYSADEQWKED